MALSYLTLAQHDEKCGHRDFKQETDWFDFLARCLKCDELVEIKAGGKGHGI